MTNSNEHTVLRERIVDLMAGWTPLANAKDWTIENVADFYNLSDTYLALDTIMPIASVMLGGDAFKRNWESEVAKMQTFQCELQEIVSQEIYGDSAWTGLIFRTQFVQETGEPVDMLIQTTLVWRKFNGKWKIVHEHLSDPVRM